MVTARSSNTRELLLGLKSGDPNAFDQVYHGYRARLFAYLLRLCGERRLAEDLLQETWLKVARRAASLKDDSVLDAWLFTIARNTYISDRRWKLLDTTRLLDFRWFSRARVVSPEDLAELNEEGKRVLRALSHLPTGYRDILLLVGHEGFSPSEAAEIVGISPEAARQRLSRARELLQKMLERKERDGQKNG